MIDFSWIIDSVKVQLIRDYGIEFIDELIGFSYELESFLKKMGLLNEFWKSLGKDGKETYDCVRTTELYNVPNEIEYQEMI